MTTYGCTRLGRVTSAMKKNGWERFSPRSADALKEKAGGVHGTFAKSLLTCVPAILLYRLRTAC